MTWLVRGWRLLGSIARALWRWTFRLYSVLTTPTAKAVWVLGVVATCVGLYQNALPNLEVTATDTMTLAQDPMSTLFVVKNNGFLPLRNVEYDLGIHQLEGRISLGGYSTPEQLKLTPEERREIGPPIFNFKLPELPRVIPPQGQDFVSPNIYLPSPKGLVPIGSFFAPMSFGDIEVNVRCNVWFFPWKSKRAYRFITIADQGQDGRLRWLPKVRDK